MKKSSIVFLIFAIGLLFANNTTLLSQAEKVRSYLKSVAQGKIDEVKRILPDLLAEYPDDPGVQLLHGVVIDDAYRAMDIYERIVKKYPDSEFADEAYWRIVQFLAVKGDTTKAIEVLDTYRKKFPNSGYLNPATDVVRSAIRVAKSSPRAYVLNLEKAPKNEEPVQKREIPPVEKTEKKMVTPINVKTVEKEKPVEKPKEDDRDARYGLQVGVYSTKEAAQAEVERFRVQRLRAEIMNKKVDGTNMFAVVIGDYSTKESAEAAKSVVQQQCNCSPIIYKK